MSWRLSFFYFLTLATLAAQAQPITGTLTDDRTGRGVPYVNVGVVGKTLGTVTDADGRYQLPFRPALAADTVRVSSVGYRVRRLPLRELQAHPNLTLTAETVGLGEVRVQAQSPFRRQHTLGFTKAEGNTTLTLSPIDYGAEIGTRIQLRRRPTLVQRLIFNLAANEVGPLTFRVNLYRLDARGQPTEHKLLPRDIILTTSARQGPLTVDLTADKLVLEEDFFLALEWLRGGDAGRVRDGVSFVAGLGYANNNLYLRPTSQARWERQSAGAVLAGMQPKIAFYATVKD